MSKLKQIPVARVFNVVKVEAFKLHLIYAALLSVITIVSSTSSQAKISPTNDFRYFFHWGDKESNADFLRTLDDQGRLTKKSEEFLAASYYPKKAYMAGQGLYVSSNPLDSSGFGEHLIVVRMPIQEIPFKNIKIDNDDATTTAKRRNLPLIARYTETFYVMPRAAKDLDPLYIISSTEIALAIENYFARIESASDSEKSKIIAKTLFELSSKDVAIPQGSEKRKIFDKILQRLKLKVLTNIEISLLIPELFRSTPKGETIGLFVYVSTTLCNGEKSKIMMCEELERQIRQLVLKEAKILPNVEDFKFIDHACYIGILTGEECSSYSQEFNQLIVTSRDMFRISRLLDLFNQSKFKALKLVPTFDFKALISKHCVSPFAPLNCELFFQALFQFPESELSNDNFVSLVESSMQFYSRARFDDFKRVLFAISVLSRIENRKSLKLSNWHNEIDKKLRALVVNNYKGNSYLERVNEYLSFYKDISQTILADILSDTKKSESLLKQIFSAYVDLKEKKKTGNFILKYLKEELRKCSNLLCFSQDKFILSLSTYVKASFKAEYSSEKLIELVQAFNHSKYFKLLVIIASGLPQDGNQTRSQKDSDLTQFLIEKLKLDGVRTLEDALVQLVALNRSSSQMDTSKNLTPSTCGGSFK